MTLQFLPFPFISGMFFLLAILVILGRLKTSSTYLIFFSLFWVYLLALIGVTLFPMPILSPIFRMPPTTILSRVNLILFNYRQFSHLSPFFIFLREIAANVILTMPFGFLINFIVRSKIKSIIMLALAVGLGIEIVQLIMNMVLGASYRGVDINDSLWNSIGVLFGYLVFWLLSKLLLAITGRQKVEQRGLFAYIHTIARRTMDT